MIKYLKLILIFPLIITFYQCKAQSDKVDDQTKSTIEVRADIAQKLTESKTNLEEVYNESVEFLDSVGTSDTENYKLFLFKSQSGWKKYCEGKCKIAEYQSRDAAQGGFAFYKICMTELNNKRTTELKNLLKGWKIEFNN
ncbi:lysozyme inhibitor LprI family protein [uncultured Marixanthomonas sp.]|uniref:lysozyme inhibitor LprI family protein n=1 Tax=uncultured Marixanthomonas sp. TaxID=757245 RepID=UPI0030D9C5AD|tara:strand:+ start:46502 stop:46921 length:420 start_codon:yes stop_codon:yes gene_type:complete